MSDNGDTSEGARLNLPANLSPGDVVTLSNFANYLSERYRPEHSDLGKLSKRETEVLYHLAMGLNCKEIARALGLSHKTVEKHQYSLRRKLKTHRTAELTRFAIREGLISP